MTRAALLLSCLFAAACSVGEVGPSTTSGPDAGARTDAGATANGCMPRLTPAGGEHPHNAPVNVNNPTNAGENCVQAGCHLTGNLGSGAPAYQFGGTVYKTGGTVPSAGAVIVLKGGGTTAMVYSDTAGNFFVPEGALTNPFTGNVSVSACPTISSMVSQVAPGTGVSGCGGEACHIGTAPTGGKIILADQ
jgi:hypothetical protein